MYGTNSQPTIDLSALLKINATLERIGTPPGYTYAASETDSDWRTIVSVSGWRWVSPWVEYRMNTNASTTGSITFDVRITGAHGTVRELTGLSKAGGAVVSNDDLLANLQSSDILVENPVIQVKVTANSCDQNSIFDVRRFNRVPVEGA